MLTKLKIYRDKLYSFLAYRFHYKRYIDDRWTSFYENLTVKIYPYEKRNPLEFFDYYAVFYYIVAQFLNDKKALKILDVGG